jgi:hypothetical protein
MYTSLHYKDTFFLFFIMKYKSKKKWVSSESDETH